MKVVKCSKILLPIRGLKEIPLNLSSTMAEMVYHVTQRVIDNTITVVCQHTPFLFHDMYNDWDDDLLRPT